MITITDICKSYGSTKVLNNVCLSVDKGEVVSIIGPSGTGKSTLLRCINFLEMANSGSIKFDDIEVHFGKVSKKEQLLLRRKTAMVFQSFCLFNNKTVLENITEGLFVVKRMDKKQAIEKAHDILHKVGLDDKAKAYPSMLSGGQQQRVGIGRAIALEPKILLFDEPTSALDPELVSEVLALIKQLASEQMTMLIVTHEIAFAGNVSNRVCFMDQGQIVEQGPAKQVIECPKNERTQRFIGHLMR